MRMQKLMSLMASRLAEELFIERHHFGAILRLAQIHSGVGTVKDTGTHGAQINAVAHGSKLIRLTAAVYTAAGTSHYLNELSVALACSDIVKHLSCI